MTPVFGASLLVFAASLWLGGAPRFLPPWTAAFIVALTGLARLLAAEKRPVESKPGALLFWSCLVLYLASFRWHGGDDIPNSVLPFMVLRHGTLSFDPVREWATNPAFHDLIIPVGGRLYSFYPVAPAVLVLPLYVIPALAGFWPTDPFIHSMGKVSGALITAASVVVLLRALEKRHPKRDAFLVAALYGLGTFAFSVSSQALWSHGPAQLGVALSLLGILSAGQGWAALAGAGLGIAATSREDSVFFCLAGAAWFLFHDRRRFFAFAAGAAVPLALNFGYWFSATGALKPPYAAIQAKMLVPVQWDALAAMLVSPARGLLTFIPATAFGVWGAARACRDPKARWAPSFAVACAATWLFYGCRDSWMGGVTFGNRYFAVVALILAFFAADALPEIRRSPRRLRAWSWAFAASVVFHALGAFLTWPGVALTLQEQAATMWDLKMHPAAYLFAPEGPLGGMAVAPRSLVACLILSLVWPLSRLVLKASERA